MVAGDPAALPPEANYLLLTTGDLAASLTTAAAGHQALSDALVSKLTQVQATAAATAGTGWQGAGSAAMVGSAQEYAATLELAAAWCQEAFAEASEVALAHQTALTSMVPAQVCTTNLATTHALVATNFLGQNSPAIAALVAEYAEFWTQNAALMNGYQSVVTQALGVLATPPPLSPTMADPVGPAAAAVANNAQSAADGGINAAAKSMDRTAEASPASAGGGQASAMLGQLSSVGGQFAGMSGQLPQLLTSAPQQLSGLFGPMSQAFGGMGGVTGVGGIAGLGVTGASPLPAVGGSAAGLTGAGGGLGGGVITGGPASASLVRPASSFAPAAPPRLPGSWGATSGAPPEPLAAPSAGAGGGLYGAPAAMGTGRDNGSSAEKNPGRSLQVTGRRAGDEDAS